MEDAENNGTFRRHIQPATVQPTVPGVHANPEAHRRDGQTLHVLRDKVFTIASPCPHDALAAVAQNKNMKA